MNRTKTNKRFRKETSQNAHKRAEAEALKESFRRFRISMGKRTWTREMLYERTRTTP